MITNNLIFIIRKILLISFYQLGKIVGLQNQTLSVLSYHSISNKKDRYSISYQNFKNQIEKISQYVEFISLDQALGNKKITKPSICLTFDDGYEDVMKILPLTKKYKIPVTIFVLSDPKNANRNELDNDAKLLTFAQIKFLISQGWTIGSHSATHADFGKLTNKELEREIKESKKVLEKRLGIKIKHFAYPKGKYQVAEKIVRSAGYKAAFSVRAGCLDWEKNNFILPRAVIDKTHDLSEFPAVFSPSTFLLRKATDRFGLWEKFLQKDFTLSTLLKVSISLAILASILKIFGSTKLFKEAVNKFTFITRFIIDHYLIIFEKKYG